MIALNYPSGYALKTWLEHRQHGTYPEAGAYNDQDPQLMDDWAAVDLRYLMILGRVQSNTMDLPTPDKDWLNVL